MSGTFTTTVAPGGVTLISARPVSGTGGTGELVSGQSGQCLDTQGNGTPGPYVYFPGTGEQIWPCNGGINQEFSVTSAGELRTMGATECLDVFNNETAPGTKVELWPCNGGANQRWTVESNGTIVGQQSGLCRPPPARRPPPGRRGRRLGGRGIPGARRGPTPGPSRGPSGPGAGEAGAYA